MTDEEKEAIERINSFKSIKVLYGKIYAMHTEQLEQLQKDIETAINLIEKQQSEMFKLQAKADRLKVARDNWKKTFYQAKAEIENKDKIIDEMASALKEYANLGFLIKCPAEYDGKYNYKYCKIDITKDRTAKTNRLCIDCIKEYFKKKVNGKT